MKKSMIFTLSMLCVAVLLSSTEALLASEKGTIKFGVLAPLTGSNAEYGKSFEVCSKTIPM